MEEHPDRIKFLVRVEGDHADEIIGYNDLLTHLEEGMTDTAEQFWNFKEIVAHEGPLKEGHPSYKGSAYNVLIIWEDGSRTFEPLSIIAADNPMVCALYAKKVGLLDTPGWKRFKSIAKDEKKLTRMLNQAKLKSFRREPTYQFGHKIPRSTPEAI